MVTTKLNLSMTEPQVRQIYAKQGDTGRVLDISLDQTPEDGTLRILRPDGVEVTSDAVIGGEVESGGTFESLTEADVTELTVGIEPVQDLNGYDAPWVGGAGKNKFQITATTQTINGVTFTVNSNGSVTVNGTASAEAVFSLGNYTLKAGKGIKYTGAPSTASTSTYWIVYSGYAKSAGYDVTADRTSATSDWGPAPFQIVVANGVTVSNAVFFPTIVDISESDTSWSPYSNICPITGHDEVTVTRTGKNLLETNDVTVHGRSFVVDNDGWISAVNTTSDSRGWGFVSSQWYLTLEQGTYALKVESDNTWTSQVNRGVRIFTEQNNELLSTDRVGDYTFTLSKQTTIGVMAKLYTGKVRLQLELGDTATTYEPYQANTYTTSLGQTVYGGTLDLVSGVLTVDRAIVDLGSLTWLKEAIPDGYRFRVILAGAQVADTEHETAICSLYALVVSGGTYARLQGFTIASNGNVYVYDASQESATVSEFTTAVTGQQLVYGLVTPQTYQLTPQQIKTLLGTNNVWASSGDIVNITFTYDGLMAEIPSEATEIVGKCYCDIEQNGVSSMPFTLNVKKNERES